MLSNNGNVFFKNGKPRFITHKDIKSGRYARKIKGFL